MSPILKNNTMLRGNTKNIVEDWRIGVARDVMRGLYGNGQYRKRLLEDRGLADKEIDEVQETVNWMLKIGIK